MSDDIGGKVSERSEAAARRIATFYERAGAVAEAFADSACLRTPGLRPWTQLTADERRAWCDHAEGFVIAFDVLMSAEDGERPVTDKTHATDWILPLLDRLRAAGVKDPEISFSATDDALDVSVQGWEERADGDHSVGANQRIAREVIRTAIADAIQGETLRAALQVESEFKRRRSREENGR